MTNGCARSPTKMLFEGCIEPVNGVSYPDPLKPGLGLEFKRSDAASTQLSGDSAPSGSPSSYLAIKCGRSFSPSMQMNSRISVPSSR